MLSTGRPRRITHSFLLARCPDGPGIYRIYTRPTTEHPTGQIYVGQATRLRTRLRSHEKIREWTWDSKTGISHIDVILGKPLATDACWDLQNLDDEEAKHINRARLRELQGGHKLVNRTIGRNGRKATLQVFEYVWQPHLSLPTEYLAED